jgi:hypothetical protein
MASRNGAVHVATTRRTYKGKTYESHLLRRSYREGSKVLHETLGNLSHLPRETIDLIRRSLRGERFVPVEERLEIVRSLPHGHVAAVLGTLREGALVLYDLTSTYFEGHTCPLARLGYSRDGKRGLLQIVFGLLTDSRGCPLAVEVFAGNTGDPSTVASQVEKLRTRFQLQSVVLVGDRGMLTAARIRDDLLPPGLSWITALRAPAIDALRSAGSLQLSLFDEKDLGEITDPAYPGERLIVCRNPLLAAERARKREELLVATERDLARIRAQVEARKLRAENAIGLRVGRGIDRFKMAKHFRLRIAAGSFRFERNQEQIAQEAALDGFYVLRTNVPETQLDTAAVVERSAAAAAQAHTKQRPGGQPVHSFRTLLGELATLARNRVRPVGAHDAACFDLLTTPTPLQREAFQRLGLTRPL